LCATSCIKNDRLYLFRAVDKQGRLIDFMLSDRRNTKAARRFLTKALKVMRN
jgi:IS6 family transposase